MKLAQLYPQAPGKMAEIEITGIADNSQNVKPGYLFVALVGPLADGHNYINDAISKGASAVICERPNGSNIEIIVEDSHRALAEVCNRFYGEPLRKIKLIGVTGTNGKTSYTYMLKFLMEQQGHKVGLIGTIQYIIGEKCIESNNTTPGILDIFSLLGEMADEGCDYCIMEVSSHALHQRRVEGLHFCVASFTNLTRDHLDYHSTMEEYLNCKKRLFYMCDKAVINYDDECYPSLTEGLPCEIFNYSQQNTGMYIAKGINYHPADVNYKLLSTNGINHVKVNVGGIFTVYNSLNAITTIDVLGLDLNKACLDIVKFKGVKGRCERVETNTDYTVIIDYAHTPDGLKNILTSFNNCEKNRLTVLFGCGGDRDKTKRPIMGEIAIRYADNVIVTSDNPRTENPTEIINDILGGMHGSRVQYKVIENRIEAIKYAISTAQSGDIIILAGKGHETYQIIGKDKIHLDEREIVLQALEE